MDDYQRGVFEGRQTIIDQMKSYHADTVYKLLVERTDILLSTEEYGMSEAFRFRDFIDLMEELYLPIEDDEDYEDEDEDDEI